MHYTWLFRTMKTAKPEKNDRRRFAPRNTNTLMEKTVTAPTATSKSRKGQLSVRPATVAWKRNTNRLGKAEK
jgi:hypothetical protein